MIDQYPPSHTPLLMMRYGWHLPIEAISTPRLDPMLNAVCDILELKGAGAMEDDINTIKNMLFSFFVPA